jgi:TetR/AcrR family transcriptional regulator, cholesterol catabolism regulator
MRYGIKSITMDDVAKELSISKKTVYQFVSDKNDLVQKTIMLHLNEMKSQCENIFGNETNAISQILNIAEMVVSRHKEMNPSLLFDLKKYHPEIYKMFSEHKECTILKQLTENFDLGIEQGYYKKNLNKTVAASFYLTLIETCISSDIQALNAYSFREKYSFLIEYHLNAICTEKGLEQIKAHQQSTSNAAK